MTCLDAARRLAVAGLSVIPIKSDGSKAPALTSWKPFQSHIARPDELTAMFPNGVGVGIVVGKVSGGLEILDLEASADWEAYSELVDQQAPGLLERLVHVETPSGGRHLYYRCREFGGNQKLAMQPGADGRPKIVIETRGDGGYALTYPRPPDCHPDKKPYRLLHGRLTQIPTISVNDRASLLDSALSCNAIAKHTETRDPSAATTASGTRPGDDFNARASWAAILEPHGWRRVGRSGERTLWRRPGKEHGSSATSNHGNSDLLYVFSTNAHPFEHETSYTKFAAFAPLEHAGDYRAAARALAGKGGGVRAEAATTAAEEPRVIQVFGGSLAPNLREAERFLADATREKPAEGVYQRAGVLVQIVRLPEPSKARGIRRTAGTLQILSVSPDTLGLKLAAAATWQKVNAKRRGCIETDVPYRLARTLCGAVSEWRNTPALAGIVEAPALRPDGSVLEAAGYDEKSGLYFDPGPTHFPTIPDNPTRGEAEYALDKLKEIVVGFPFVDEASRAVAVASVMTPIVRHAVRAVPLFGHSAPKMGSGKTLLAYLPAYVATGRPPALMSQASDPGEEKKRFLGILMEGSVVNVIDNCELPMKSDALCTILTEPAWSERLLGENRKVTVSTTTTWLATGNALRLVGDLSSRVLLCSIDARCERPEEREFSVNLHDEAPKRRGELAAATLTITRAFLASGERVQVPRYGRFEEWSRFVREPLIWLGMEDPCETRKAVEAKDSVRQQLSGLLTAWRDAFGTEGRTVAEALREINESEEGKLVEIQKRDALETLNHAMRAVAEEKGCVNTRRLGNFLSKHEDRIEGGLRFERVGVRQSVAVWKVHSPED